MIFKGSATALITPFTTSGEVDFDALKNLLDFQMENSHAIIVLGTTGEASTITKNEKMAIVQFAVDYVAGAVPVLAGSGGNDTAAAKNASKTYANLGVDGLLVVTPYYNKCTQNGLVEHYFNIADSVDKQLMLYNVPARTGVNMLPATVEKLSQHKNITAIKEASGNIGQIAEIKRTSNIDIYSGDDGLIYSVLALGGKGVVSVAGNIIPKQIAQICDYYFNNQQDLSLNLQLEILPLITALFSEVNPIPVKKAAELLNLCTGTLRLPLTEMEEGNAIILKEQLAKYYPRLA